MIKKYSIVFALLFIFAFNGCKESTTKPCGPDIKITIMAQYNDCNGNCLPAEEAFITITQNSGTNVVILDSGETIKGKYTYTPIASGCGISNISFTVRPNNLSNLPGIETYSYICTDTTMIICMPCDTFPQTTCNSPGKIDSIHFIDENSGNDCIPIGTKIKPDARSYTNTTGSKIIVENIASILNYNQKLASGNKFRLVMSDPDLKAAAGGTYTLKPGESLILYFDFITDEIGKFIDKIQLPVYCESNPSAKANWEINLLAEVCPTPCDCPYSTDKDPYYAGLKDAESLQLNETKTFNNVKVLEILPTALQQGCYMVINDIVRIDDKGAEYSTIGGSNNPYQINPSNLIDDWTILNQGPYTNQIKAGGSLSLNVKIGPVSRSDYLRDTFKLRTTIYDKNGAVKDANCEYKFYLQGNVCEDVCAVIDLLSVSKGIFNEVNTQNLTDIWNVPQWINPRRITSQETLPLVNFYNIKEIFCNFESSPSPEPQCGNQTPESFEFAIHLPTNTISCNTEQTYQFERKNPYPNPNDPYFEADAKYFSFTTGSGALATISNNEQINLKINFKAPSYSEWSSMITKDPNKKYLRYRLAIRDAESDKDCHIVLNFLVELNNIPRVGPIRMLYAYNQITTKQPIPDSMAVKIDQEHPDGYWGVDKNKVPGIGNTPNSEDSFFINVGSPNGAIGQAPLLNLVPTAANPFKYISVPAIRTYNSDNAFKNDYVNLINQTLFNTNNCFIEPPSRLNTSFNGINGIQVQPGDVYAVWTNERVGACQNPCKLALIYVYEVSNGSNTPPNQSDVSNIRYRIVYPINK